MSNTEIDDMEIESVVELINRLARKHSDINLPYDEYQKIDDWEDISKLDDRIGFEVADRFAEFEDHTNLSGNEAHVVALKEIGVTHRGIAFRDSLYDENSSKSTVDEYSRRARQKYLKAKKTVELLEPVYGDDSQ